MKEKKETLGFYMIPLTVIKKILDKPEVALFLLVKMYEKLYPNVSSNNIYDAISGYLDSVEFTVDKVESVEHETDAVTVEVSFPVNASPDEIN